MTRRCFAHAAAASAVLALCRPAPSAVASAVASAVFELNGRPTRIRFEPSGLLDVPTTDFALNVEGGAGAFVVESVDVSDWPFDPHPDDCRPLRADVSTAIVDTIIRHWAPGDAERCHLCKVGCGRYDNIAGGQSCIVWIPPGSVVDDPAMHQCDFPTAARLA